jgi:uncharacterized protein
MKLISPEALERLPGIVLRNNDTFGFRCHNALACFNRCCRNLNLFLYPYDVVRLRRSLHMDADRFLEEHVDVVSREGNYFPEVLLRMADNESRTCPFLNDAGCGVYPDRPDTCRTFPVEHGMLFSNRRGHPERVSFFRPPDFCQGRHANQVWTLSEWAADQEAVGYNQMTARWASVKALFHQNPWGSDGPSGPTAKMAFMAAYNIDRFRDFVFQSSFLSRYRVKPKLVKQLRFSDRELLLFGFEWIRFIVWGIPSALIGR